jgi:Uma2 family endonuclease
MAATAPNIQSGAQDSIESAFLTSEQFLEWLEPGVQADLISGSIFMHSPVNRRHSNLLSFIDRVLGTFIDIKKLGELHREGFVIRLAQRDVFMPDLAFFTTEQAAKLHDTYATFAPVLAVEALSPSSVRHDLRDKFAAYEEHGVQEYWVLDPDGQNHRFFRREGSLLVEFASGTERIESVVVPGFWLLRSWLDAGKLPPVQTVLDEILRASSR